MNDKEQIQESMNNWDITEERWNHLLEWLEIIENL